MGSEDRGRQASVSTDLIEIMPLWAAAGFKDTLLRCSMKREVFYGYEKAIQPGIQV